MATMISNGDVVLSPVAVDGYRSSRAVRTIVHSVIDRANPDITIRPSQLRSGVLTMIFRSEEESKVADDAHAAGGAFALLNPDTPTVGMTYIPVGTIDREKLPAGGWSVVVGYQEVSA